MYYYTYQVVLLCWHVLLQYTQTCTITYVLLRMLHIFVYCANVATLSCRRSKRNAAAAEEEGAAAGLQLLGVPGGGQGQAVGLPWRRACPGSAPGSPYQRGSA